jgi:tetratricopeptide (TPR) repeat protein
MLLNFKLFGLHAGMWHLSALALHLIVTWQVYRLALSLLGGDETISLIAAALFGLHPAHVEAVAWIAGATETLAAICILAALLSYANFRSTGHRKCYVITLAWFAAGMLLKETSAVLPALLVSYDLLFSTDGGVNLRARTRASLVRMLPFGVTLACYLAARYHVLHGLSHPYMNLSAAVTLMTIPSVLLFYARILLWPVGLALFYDLPYTTAIRDALLPGILCVAIAALIAFALWRSRSRVSAFTLIVLFLPLAPVLNLKIFARSEIVHDRYLYLPSLGFCILLATGFRWLWQRLPGWKLSPKVALAAVSALALFYFGATFTQSLYWADDLILYGRGVQVAPHSLVARTNLANELFTRGDRQTAVVQYRAVLARDPYFWLARYNLGYAEYTAGDCTGAVRDLGIASRINPTDAETFFYLGDCQFRLGDRQQGIATMRHSLEVDPRRPNVRAGLADALVQDGNPDDLRAALELYRAEAAGNPLHPTAARRAAELQSRLAGN